MDKPRLTKKCIRALSFALCGRHFYGWLMGRYRRSDTRRLVRWGYLGRNEVGDIQITPAGIIALFEWVQSRRRSSK